MLSFYQNSLLWKNWLLLQLCILFNLKVINWPQIIIFWMSCNPTIDNWKSNLYILSTCIILHCPFCSYLFVHSNIYPTYPFHKITLTHLTPIVNISRMRFPCSQPTSMITPFITEICLLSDKFEKIETFVIPYFFTTEGYSTQWVWQFAEQS